MATVADFHGQMYMLLAKKSGQKREPVGSPDAPATNPIWKVGGWTQYPDNANNIQHSINANNILLVLKDDIQEKWLIIGGDNQPINDIALSAFKYDDLRANDDFVGFYFLKINAGSFFLYCRVGLMRQKNIPPKLCKLSNKEKDVYS